MFSLNKNKNQAEEQEQMADSQLNQDLIVHNMPQSDVAKPAVSSSIRRSSGFSGVNEPKKNFKAVGLIIMAVGLVFIGVIVYLSYRFIISPATKNNVVPVTNNEVAVKPTTTAEIPVTIATSSALATSVPETINLATTTASTTDEQAKAGATETKPVIDTDNDGLTDDEEALLGTSATSTDTNGNGYTDLVEINNNYNPAGAGRLNANSNLAIYTNKAIGYDILYPKSWVKQTVNDEATAIFTALDNSLVQVSVQDNSDKATILSWYENTFPDVTVSYDKLKSTDNWEGIWGEDHLNFYLTDKKHTNIYVVSYTPAEDGREIYSNIFKLMINSLKIK